MLEILGQQVVFILLPKMTDFSSMPGHSVVYSFVLLFLSSIHSIIHWFIVSGLQYFTHLLYFDFVLLLFSLPCCLFNVYIISCHFISYKFILSFGPLCLIKHLVGSKPILQKNEVSIVAALGEQGACVTSHPSEFQRTLVVCSYQKTSVQCTVNYCKSIIVHHFVVLCLMVHEFSLV